MNSGNWQQILNLMDLKICTDFMMITIYLESMKERVLNWLLCTQ